MAILGNDIGKQTNNIDLLSFIILVVESRWFIYEIQNYTFFFLYYNDERCLN